MADNLSAKSDLFDMIRVEPEKTNEETLSFIEEFQTKKVSGLAYSLKTFNRQTSNKSNLMNKRDSLRKKVRTNKRQNKITGKNRTRQREN